MAEPMQCPKCPGTSLVEGALQSTGSVRFRPASAKFLTFRTADIAIRAAMCPHCGHVALVGDPNKLRLLLPVLSSDAVDEPVAAGR